jgi:hypothetical protein
MNRWISAIVCLLWPLTLSLNAQEENSEPISPPSHHVQPKIGGAGGFTQNLLFLDLDPINSVLKGSNCAAFDKQPMLLLGGQGYGYIMLIPNLRIGGMGAGGSMESRSLDTGVSPNLRRDVSLSVNYGGVTIEYAVPIIPRLDVSLGLLLGGGSTTIDIYQYSSTNQTWDDVWGSIRGGSSVGQYKTTLSSSFFIYQPSLNIEYAVLRWVGIRLGVSYNGMAGSDWKVDDKSDLLGVPTGISGKGFMINGGIFLGTFLFD